MKKNSLTTPDYFIRLRSLLKRFLIILFLASIVIFTSVAYIRHLTKISDIFFIREVFVQGEDALNASYFIGKNIFSFSPKEGSRYLAQMFPEYKVIRLIRILPNALFIDFLKRKPVAIVMLSRNFYLDNTSTIFESNEPVFDLGLVLIKGLGKKVFAPSSGKHYNIPELNMALAVLKEINSYGNLKGYRMKELSFVNSSEALIIFEEGLEVRLGEEGLKDKIKLLAGLLKQTPGGISAIKYIDLRFQETVVKFKNAN
jgi:cell division septal protein FtsQ